MSMNAVIMVLCWATVEWFIVPQDQRFLTNRKRIPRSMSENNVIWRDHETVIIPDESSKADLPLLGLPEAQQASIEAEATSVSTAGLDWIGVAGALLCLILAALPSSRRWLRTWAPLATRGLLPCLVTTSLYFGFGPDVLAVLRKHPLAFQPSPAIRAALLVIGSRSLVSAWGLVVVPRVLLGRHLGIWDSPLPIWVWLLGTRSGSLFADLFGFARFLPGSTQFDPLGAAHAWTAFTWATLQPSSRRFVNTGRASGAAALLLHDLLGGFIHLGQQDWMSDASGFVSEVGGASSGQAPPPLFGIDTTVSSFGAGASTFFPRGPSVSDTSLVVMLQRLGFLVVFPYFPVVCALSEVRTPLAQVCAVFAALRQGLHLVRLGLNLRRAFKAARLEAPRAEDPLAPGAAAQAAAQAAPPPGTEVGLAAGARAEPDGDAAEPNDAAADDGEANGAEEDGGRGGREEDQEREVPMHVGWGRLGTRFLRTMKRYVNREAASFATAWWSFVTFRYFLWPLWFLNVMGSLGEWDLATVNIRSLDHLLVVALPLAVVLEPFALVGYFLPPLWPARQPPARARAAAQRAAAAEGGEEGEAAPGGGEEGAGEHGAEAAERDEEGEVGEEVAGEEAPGEEVPLGGAFMNVWLGPQRRQPPPRQQQQQQPPRRRGGGAPEWLGPQLLLLDEVFRGRVEDAMHDQEMQRLRRRFRWMPGLLDGMQQGFGLPPSGQAPTPVHWPPPLAMTDDERAGLEESIATDRVPHALRCSITHELMREPAVVNGHCFERRAIAAWLASNPRDPVTREPASPSDLRPDWSVRAAVTFFLDQARTRVVQRTTPSPPPLVPTSPYPTSPYPPSEITANCGGTSNGRSSMNSSCDVANSTNIDSSTGSRSYANVSSSSATSSRSRSSIPENSTTAAYSSAAPAGGDEPVSPIPSRPSPQARAVAAAEARALAAGAAFASEAPAPPVVLDSAPAPDGSSKKRRRSRSASPSPPKQAKSSASGLS